MYVKLIIDSVINVKVQSNLRYLGVRPTYYAVVFLKRTYVLADLKRDIANWNSTYILAAYFDLLSKPDITQDAELNEIYVLVLISSKY